MRRTVFAVAASLLWLAACRDPAESTERREGVVATVNGAAITRAELESYEASLAVRARGPAERGDERGLLEELVTQELLSQEAQKRGYAEHPRVRAMMAGLLRADALDSRSSASILGETAAVSEEEIRAYHEANPTEFAIPEKLRARRILVSFGADRDASRKQAEELREQAVANPGAFGDLAFEHSDGPERRRRGELGFLAAEDPARTRLDPKLVEVAFALQEGEISPVFEAADGWTIVQVMTRVQGGGIDSPRVREAIRRQLDRIRREERYAEWVASLRSAAEVAIDEQAIAGGDAPKP